MYFQVKKKVKTDYLQMQLIFKRENILKYAAQKPSSKEELLFVVVFYFCNCKVWVLLSVRMDQLRNQIDSRLSEIVQFHYLHCLQVSFYFSLKDIQLFMRILFFNQRNFFTKLKMFQQNHFKLYCDYQNNPTLS